MNIDYQRREAMTKKAQDPTHTSFDEAQKTVYIPYGKGLIFQIFKIIQILPEPFEPAVILKWINFSLLQFSLWWLKSPADPECVLRGLALTSPIGKT